MSVFIDKIFVRQTDILILIRTSCPTKTNIFLSGYVIGKKRLFYWKNRYFDWKFF